MTLRKPVLLVPLLILALNARAQFYVAGDDPGSIRWYKLKTPHYSILYPKGTDSLAYVYGTLLEKYRTPESWSTGLLPGEGYQRRTPVILRIHTGEANGFVSWAPRRMELYTLPSFYDAEPAPWAKNLAIHESRHLSQMQFAYKHALKPFTWLLGDLLAGGASAIYPSLHLLEGDAVVAETALTTYGRGRNAAFLNYYMPAFDAGDWRTWARWRYGSFRKYTPNHYALGYMTIAGTRYFYDDPLFMKNYLDLASRRPFRLFGMRKEIKSASGKKFKEAFGDIMMGFHDIWNEEAVAREPFIPYTQVNNEDSFYVSYEENVGVCENVITKKTGYLMSPALYMISPDGKERKLRAFASSAGDFSYDEITGRLYWSESVADIRWDMKNTSRIRYMDIGDSLGRAKDLTRKGRYFSPSPATDGSSVVAIESPYEGGSCLVLINAVTGEVVKKVQAPDSLQLAELAVDEGDLIVAGISEKGAGLYKVADFFLQDLSLGHGPGLFGRTFSQVAGPQPVTVKDLKESAEGVLFVCDRTGADEIYMLRGNDVLQLTSTRYGATDGTFNAAGDTLFFSSMTPSGKYLFRAAASDLLYRKVSFEDIHHYRIADTLTAQERELAAEAGDVWPDDNPGFSTEFSAPERHYILPNIPHFHSWAPLYVDYDNTNGFSSYSYDYAFIGATAYFQNLLGNAYGLVGYSYHKGVSYDPAWRHSGHLRFTYRGLPPVVKFNLDFNDRNALQYTRTSTETNSYRKYTLSSHSSDRPLLSGELELSLPLNFSSGGVFRGLVPRVVYSFSNDCYNKSTVDYTYIGNLSGSSVGRFSGYSDDDNVYMQMFETTVAGYIMRATPSMLQYPRLGAGLQLGYRFRTGMADMYSGGGFAYAYFFLPGLTKTHGIRLTTLWQHIFKNNSFYSEGHVTVRPRGMVSSALSSYIANYSTDQLKLTMDYPISFSLGDLSLQPFTYITHFVISPHVDYTLFNLNELSGTSGRLTDGGLVTAGCNITAKAAHLLWFPYEVEFGIECDWNGGKSYKLFKNSCGLQDFWFGPIFTATF